MEKSELYANETQCLRTCDALGLWRDADDVMRRAVVCEFVKKVSNRSHVLLPDTNAVSAVQTIYPGALSGPLSPVVPHTLFSPQTEAISPAPPMTASLPPFTQYTPFTAFASKQNPVEYASRTDGSVNATAPARISGRDG